MNVRSKEYLAYNRFSVVSNAFQATSWFNYTPKGLVTNRIEHSPEVDDAAYYRLQFYSKNCDDLTLANPAKVKPPSVWMSRRRAKFTKSTVPIIQVNKSSAGCYMIVQ